MTPRPNWRPLREQEHRPEHVYYGRAVVMALYLSQHIRESQRATWPRSC